MSISGDLWPSPETLGSPTSGAAVWWLGQVGFLIEMGGLRIVIDAYLSDSLAEKYKGKRFPHIRMTQAPVAPGDLEGIDWLLCTHGHTDHMDPGTIPPLLAVNPEAKVVVPRSDVARATERGVSQDRLVAVNDGEWLDLGGVTLFATPAAHETLSRDGQGNAHFLGYALRGPDATIWHSGDTVPFPGLVESVAPLLVDLVLLPVNGRENVRASNGVPGNLTLEEAVALTEEVGAEAMLGHHLDLFDFNTLDRDIGQKWLSKNADCSRVHLVELGKRYVVRSNSAGTPRKILAICRGNICRSPLAEGILADLLKHRSDWVVDSAVIKNWNVGRAPDKRSINIAKTHGLDLTRQRARQITSADFRDFDLILAMDADNCTALAEVAPVDATARILRLGDLIRPGQRYDIADPYDYGEAEFEKCFAEISIACVQLAKRI